MLLVEVDIFHGLERGPHNNTPDMEEYRGSIGVERGVEGYTMRGGGG